MKMRFALLLSLVLPLMVACKAQDGTADVQPAAGTEAPAATTDAAGAVDATDSTATDGSGQAAAGEGQAAAAPAPAANTNPPAVPQGPAPVEGTDFVLIDGGVPYAPVAGKIEVVEIFGYVCPACFRFQSILAPWKARLPADVEFIYLPASFGGTWDDYARAYFAAKTLGVQEATHEPLYAAIHIEGKLKGERGRDSVEDIAAFYAAHGVDAKRFTDTMASFGVNAQAARAKQFAMRSKITGTPSLIINGKYLVKGKSFEDMLRIADHLIARERAGA